MKMHSRSYGGGPDISIGGIILFVLMAVCPPLGIFVFIIALLCSK